MRRLLLALLVVTVSLLGPTTRALIIQSGEGDTNTTAPPDDPGWDSIGVLVHENPVALFNGVYLGNRWMLAAAHVLGGNGTVLGVGSDVKFGGVQYTAEPGTSFSPRLPTGTVPHRYSDLLIWRLTSAPPVAGVPIATATAAIGEFVVLAASSPRVRGAAFTQQPSYSWMGSQTFSGWTTIAGTSQLRWGTNRVSDYGPNRDLQVGMYFSNPSETANPNGDNWTPDEAQAVYGDSSGIVFVKRDGVWQVLGVITSASSTGGANGNESYDGIDSPAYEDPVVNGNWNAITIPTVVTFAASEIIQRIQAPSRAPWGAP